MSLIVSKSFSDGSLIELPLLFSFSLHESSFASGFGVDDLWKRFEESVLVRI
jgi:hypothetical protein